MKTIATILQESNNCIGVYGRPPAPEPQSDRQYTVTPLDSFRYDHLSQPEHKETLQKAVNGVKEWMARAKTTAGLSLILCGAFGTGKTTMAENAMGVFKTPMIAKNPNADIQAALVKSALENQRMSDSVREILRLRLIELEDGIPIGEVMQGSLKSATMTMTLVEQGLSLNYDRDKVIVVDDVGSEEIPFTSEAMFINKRQVRYGNLIEYCYRHGKNLILTSNLPLYTFSNEGVFYSQGFIDTVSGRGFDRLLQMADGYMFDLTGLPSYRPYVVKR